MRLTSLVLLPLFFSSAICEDKEEKPQLPLCEHINPKTNLKEWLNLETRLCNHTSPEEKSPEEKILYDTGVRAFAFDAVASDRLGPRRDPGQHAHKLCKTTSFESDKTVSIIIIHHNECLSVLLRMLIGIFDRTAEKSLKEIILYEDASEETHQLTKALTEARKIMKWGEKVHIHRSEERLGLIKAKTLASRMASGDVLIFLDSHCEVTENWLPPLLQPIEENENSVVLPVVDLIHPASFDYSQAMKAKSGFDWSLTFKWEYIPWDYFDKEENNVLPFESPSMPGGLLAVRTEFFRNIGEFDEGMEIWGAENVELSLKTWMCGGRVVVAPCSRVGHVFRMFRPYKSKPGQTMDTNLFNSLRVAKAWLGPYEKYFLKARPAAEKLDVGDLSKAADIQKKMDCKDMKWYIDNVYPNLKPVEREEL